MTDKMKKPYHLVAGIDFTHCERGECKNCLPRTQKACERKLNRKEEKE